MGFSIRIMTISDSIILLLNPILDLLLMLYFLFTK